MNFFYQVKESVIDFKFYNTIKNNRFAKTFLYMLLLLLISYSMITVRNYLAIKTQMEMAAFELTENIPDFELKDGKFRFEGKMPYYITTSTNETIIIDTTGTVDKSTLKDEISGILITEDKVYMKSPIQEQEYHLSQLRGSDFNKQDVVEFLPSISWLVLIGMLVWFAFAVAGHLLFAVLLALIGMMISSKAKANFTFKQLMNFSIYALTLPIFIDLAMDVSALFPPIFVYLVYVSVAVTYMVHAIAANKDECDSLPHSDRDHLA